MANANPIDNRIRAILGANLQTGALRAILLLAAFAFIGALLAYFVV